MAVVAHVDVVAGHACPWIEQAPRFNENIAQDIARNVLKNRERKLDVEAAIRKSGFAGVGRGVVPDAGAF